MTATHWSAIDSTRTGADNLGVRHTEANAYTRLARIYRSEGWKRPRSVGMEDGDLMVADRESRSFSAVPSSGAARR